MHEKSVFQLEREEMNHIQNTFWSMLSSQYMDNFQ